ncbi:ribosome hibernation-promoting factor, HPF/YfiA family [Rubrobacter indicoceani]|uniref:ribosome hibernation-promoting factor, HPF/YfiA family n=1 Tax=Rubrobacter indicoceani TaxID=2051957 RepID=UPI000E5B1F1A|nr:ribosome-associated translation inhibitor RaiA [Rubrobacter indicoceani]
MEVIVKGKNLSVTDALDAHAREKVERIARFFDEEKSDCRAEVELIHERNRARKEPEIVEATLFLNGSVIKATESSVDMYAAIDGMGRKLERQVKRFRSKQVDRWHGERDRQADLEPKPFVVDEVEEEEIEAKIVKTKQFQVKPMGPEEAVMQMELLEHDFFVFTSAESGDVSVVYRRHDGDYGLIEPTT